MLEMALALLGFILFIVLMASGYILARKRLQGSCGGLGQLFGACDVCGNKDNCPEKKGPSSAKLSKKR